MTEQALDHVAQWSGVPREDAEDEVTDTSGDAGDMWDRFDSAMESRQLLSGVKRSIESNQEQIDYMWGGGPAQESSARIDSDVERVRSILTRHGYEEVSVAVGVDVDLAADRKLGGFYRTPDTDEPRWTAHVIFKLVGGSET
jgi:hypothetical protein